ncbi:SpoIID/LytB domain-containing protein [Baaleninema sp.]|uniref:SpoIID/LytB domain-containing protein n=1 Tax=Baaleninema sp. TaxID=3101197 RepID=UPI003CFCD26B
MTANTVTPRRHSRHRKAARISAIALLTLSLSALFPNLAKAFEIKVGVVQRFGDEPGDSITLEPANSESLTVTYLGGDGTPQTQQLPKLKLEVLSQPLETSVLEERVVLSTHRSYENAEQSAKEWRDRGIEVEIAQPSDIWEVWAKRDVYQTPLLRRLLIENLKNQGFDIAYLQNQVLDRRLQAGWEKEGFRYNRDEIEIESSGAIRVVEGDTQHTYGGTLRLQPNAYGSYTLVNDVSIETYLRGVVPHEIGPNAPYAAVEAQAIIARTYAVRNLHRFKIDNYQLCADTHCQVYWGLDNTVDKADRAIAATAGQILTYNNEPIDALYSSTTGGITAPFEDVWDGEPRPYLTAVVDSVNGIWDIATKPLNDDANLKAFMALNDGFNESEWNTFRWNKPTSLKEMTDFLKRYYRRNNRQIDFSEIKQVDIVERSRSGRILKMTITTDRGVIEIPNDEIRNAFYPPISTLFYLDPIYEENGDTKTLWGYRFIGGGFGHGVGLSQTGAYHLADVGKSSREILDFYYPGTELKLLEEVF